MGILFTVISCEKPGDDSLEALNLSNDEDKFITFIGPDGEIVRKEIPTELIKSKEVAKSRADCEMKIINNYATDWVGVSVDGSNVMVPAADSTTADCPCSGTNAYVWLVTSGGGRSIEWKVYHDASPTVIDTSGVLPKSNGSTSHYY